MATLPTAPFVWLYCECGHDGEAYFDSHPELSTTSIVEMNVSCISCGARYQAAGELRLLRLPGSDVVDGRGGVLRS
jgi:hypothetical protein